MIGIFTSGEKLTTQTGDYDLTLEGWVGVNQMKELFQEEETSCERYRGMTEHSRNYKNCALEFRAPSSTQKPGVSPDTSSSFSTANPSSITCPSDKSYKLIWYPPSCVQLCCQHLNHHQHFALEYYNSLLTKFPLTLFLPPPVLHTSEWYFSSIHFFS